MGTVNVGSKNPVKVAALREIIQDYGVLEGSEVKPIGVDSGVHKQPKGLEEIITGAKNRARRAFKGCTYSVGIEAGIEKIPHTKSGWMNITACAVFDGRGFHIGLSSGFEYPKRAIRLVVEEGLDINQAFYKAGITRNPKIGYAEGAIGLLTKGRLPRKDYIKQAIKMALIHLENKELYG